MPLRNSPSLRQVALRVRRKRKKKIKIQVPSTVISSPRGPRSFLEKSCKAFTFRESSQPYNCAALWSTRLMTLPRKTQHGAALLPCWSGEKPKAFQEGTGEPPGVFSGHSCVGRCCEQRPWALCSCSQPWLSRFVLRHQDLHGQIRLHHQGHKCVHLHVYWGSRWVLQCDMPNTLSCNLWFGVCVSHYFWKLPSLFLQVQSKCGVTSTVALQPSSTGIDFGCGGRLGRNWHYFIGPLWTWHLFFARVCHPTQQNHPAVTSI